MVPSFQDRIESTEGHLTRLPDGSGLYLDHSRLVVRQQPLRRKDGKGLAPVRYATGIMGRNA